MEAYNLQDQGLDTVEANIQLGHQPDERDYGIAARILRDLGVSAIRLITNNPHKVEELGSHGIEVVTRIPIEVGQHEENLGYLKSKAERMAHWLRFTEQVPTDQDFDFLGPLLDQLALARNPGQSRPFVTLTYAQSLDGVPLAKGKMLNDLPRDIALGQYLDAHHDAVLLTANDDWMTFLRSSGASLRVILDPDLLWGDKASVADLLGSGTLVITSSDHNVERRHDLEAKGVRVVALRSVHGESFDPSEILDVLLSQGVQTLLVHGDEKTIGSFLGHQRVDYCVITLATCFLGGASRDGSLGHSLPEMRACLFHSQGSDLVAFGAMSYRGSPIPRTS